MIARLRARFAARYARDEEIVMATLRRMVSVRMPAAMLARLTGFRQSRVEVILRRLELAKQIVAESIQPESDTEPERRVYRLPRPGDRKAKSIESPDARP